MLLLIPMTLTLILKTFVRLILGMFFSPPPAKTGVHDGESHHFGTEIAGLGRPTKSGHSRANPDRTSAETHAGAGGATAAAGRQWCWWCCGRWRKRSSWPIWYSGEHGRWVMHVLMSSSVSQCNEKIQEQGSRFISSTVPKTPGLAASKMYLMEVLVPFGYNQGTNKSWEILLRKLCIWCELSSMILTSPEASDGWCSHALHPDTQLHPVP